MELGVEVRSVWRKWRCGYVRCVKRGGVGV